MEKLDTLDIVKWGTTVLTREDNSRVDHNTLNDYGEVIDQHSGALLGISSGAIGFANSLATDFADIDDEVVQKQIKAMAGNPHLAAAWDQAIRHKQVLQGLITQRSFEVSNNARQNIIKVLQGIYLRGTQKFVVMANENDFESDDELTTSRDGKIGDNDENVAKFISPTQEIAESVRATIITESGGVYTQKGKGELIADLSSADITQTFLDEICGPSINGGSPKGMRAKLISAKKSIEEGAAEFFIAGGKNANDLQGILNGEHKGTKITASHNLTEV